jgi:hypothetical protein
MVFGCQLSDIIVLENVLDVWSISISEALADVEIAHGGLVTVGHIPSKQQTHMSGGAIHAKRKEELLHIVVILVAGDSVLVLELFAIAPFLRVVSCQIRCVR